MATQIKNDVLMELLSRKNVWHVYVGLDRTRQVVFSVRGHVPAVEGIARYYFGMYTSRVVKHYTQFVFERAEKMSEDSDYSLFDVPELITRLSDTDIAGVFLLAFPTMPPDQSNYKGMWLYGSVEGVNHCWVHLLAGVEEWRIKSGL